MNPFIILLICSMILLASYLWYISYDSSHVLLPQERHSTDVLLSDKNRVRCPPETSKKSNSECQDIHLYDDRDVIKNKGFINDMIYKPQQDMSELQFENKLLDNKMPLNPISCDEELSTDLPLSNVNVNYLLKYNTAKLSI